MSGWIPVLHRTFNLVRCRQGIAHPLWSVLLVQHLGAVHDKDDHCNQEREVDVLLPRLDEEREEDCIERDCFAATCLAEEGESLQREVWHALVRVLNRLEGGVVQLFVVKSFGEKDQKQTDEQSNRGSRSMVLELVAALVALGLARAFLFHTVVTARSPVCHLFDLIISNFT